MRRLLPLLWSVLLPLLGVVAPVASLSGCDVAAPPAESVVTAAPSAAQAPVTSATRAEGQRVDIRRQTLRDESDAGLPDAAPPPKVPTLALVRGPTVRVVEAVEVRGREGEVILRGRVDLGPSIDRILAGRAFPHRNDGAIFENRERRLPTRPPGHYREYVHPTPGLRGPGPQRIVVGRAGAWYYTPDHYRTFRPLTPGEPMASPEPDSRPSGEAPAPRAHPPKQESAP